MYQKCWICNEILKDVVYLPDVDEFFGDNVPIFKSTFIIKDVGEFKFLYYLICEKCCDSYLKYYSRRFEYLKKRELGLKI
jgi:hypothetical protein